MSTLQNLLEEAIKGDTINVIGSADTERDYIYVPDAIRVAADLARHREAERDYADRNFIRVDWPAVPMEVVIDKVAADGENSPFHRMCISMITHPDSEHDTFSVLDQWTSKIDPDAMAAQVWDLLAESVEATAGGHILQFLVVDHESMPTPDTFDFGGKESL